MPRSTFSTLHPAIAGRSVDPDRDVALFSPLEGMEALIDRTMRMAPERPGEPGGIDRRRIKAACLRVEAASGMKTRNRRKAAAAAFALHHSLAALGIVPPRAAIHALGRALYLDSDLAKLPTWTRGKTGHFADGWLSGEDPDPLRPAAADLAALRIIGAARAADGPANLGLRRAAFALADWHRHHRRSLSAVAVNALGFVTGMVGTNGRLNRLMGAHVLGHDPIRLLEHARLDADAGVADRAPPSAKEHRRTDRHLSDAFLYRMRQSDPYQRLEREAVGQATKGVRTRTGLAELHDAAWAKFREHGPQYDRQRDTIASDRVSSDMGPAPRQLADWRRTYWRMWRMRRDS